MMYIVNIRTGQISKGYTSKARVRRRLTELRAADKREGAYEARVVVLADERRDLADLLEADPFAVHDFEQVEIDDEEVEI